MATEDSPFRRLWHATWRATKLEEQAVSTVKLGPRKSKKCDNLFDCIACAHPVSEVNVSMKI